MPTTMQPPARFSAGGLLVLYVVSLAGVSYLDQQGTIKFPTSLIYVAVPFALLGVATRVSFKRGGFISRIVALIFVVHILGTTAWGVMRGFSNVVARNEGIHEANAEFAQLDNDFATDTGTDSVTALANRQIGRRRAAATRLQSSENPNAATIGQALELVEDIMKPSNKRLLAAGEAVRSDRFRDIPGLLSSGKFAWHKSAAHEYAEAVVESRAAFQSVPAAVQRQLASSDMDPHAVEAFVRGMTDARAKVASLLEANARVADAYQDYLTYAQAHLAGIHVEQDRIRVDAGPTKDGYDKRVSTMTAAEEELVAMASAMLPGVAKR